MFDIVRGIIQKGVPVVFVTGLPEKVAFLASTRANVRVFTKPVECAALLEGISRLLAESGL
ncbi:MAG: hypothetical protein KKH28_07740 [Elusimicrobia bacterium]|nr:hypothetical protein [Elusimicrobiota bacterium]